MNYMLNGILKEEDQQLVRKSYVVEGSKVTYVTDRFYRLNIKQIVHEGFRIAPGRVMADDTLERELSIHLFKETVRLLMNKGCTTIVHFVSASYEREIPHALKVGHHRLNNSFLDYMLALSLPLHLVRQTVLRLCKKVNVSIIRIKITSIEELVSKNWSEIRDLSLFYPIVFLPDYTSLSEKDRGIALRCWNEIRKEYRLPSEASSPVSQTPWSKPLLLKTGLYPQKGELRVGADADYLLYDVGRSNAILDDPLELDYDREEPAIVVLRGQVLKAGNQHLYTPGFGRPVTRVVPGQFVPMSEASGWNH